MNIFNSVASRRPKRNKFDLSHEVKCTLNMGRIYPVYFDEVVPGDSFRVKSEVMLRFAPLAAPVMHRMNVFMHYFFVPNRLVWDEWEDFITGGEDGLANPVHPYLTYANAANGGGSSYSSHNLSAFLGLGNVQNASGSQRISSLPHRAYALIYNEYYRDQDLVDKVIFSKSSGSDDAYRGALNTIRTRAWEKDYFTSARPWAQKGDPVGVPLRYDEGEGMVRTVDGSTAASGATSLQPIGIEGSASLRDSSNTPLELNEHEININDLRRAARIQEWLEKNARAGSRYVESILSHFGTRLSDYRAQRPVYLGGGMQPVTVSEVLQTAQDPGTTGNGYGVGDLYGHGISVGAQNRFKGNFQEHGHVFGILSVMPKTAYQQGIPRTFRKADKFDYYWPEFANIGEQPVYQSEIYCEGDLDLDQDTVFGYQQRYAEYKYKPDRVVGSFQGSLNYWHLGRVFESQPALNDQFVNSAPSTRIFNVPEEFDHLWCQVYNKVDAIRPMPYNAIPTL